MREGDREVHGVERIHDAIARLHAAPQSQDARRRLRAVVSQPALLEPAVPILADAARRALCEEPSVAVVLLELLIGTFDALDRPIEATTTMEQLVALTPDNVDHLYTFGLRCLDSGAWTKAAEAFERVGTLGQRDQACLALRAASKLYVDHGQLDRAVAAHRAICTRRPSDREAWRSLEALLERLGQWREVAEVRAELAKRTSNALDRAKLLRGQARALEQSDDAAGAAAAMAAASALVPDDTSGVLDFADVLARTGKPREAADVCGMRLHAAHPSRSLRTCGLDMQRCSKTAAAIVTRRRL